MMFPDLFQVFSVSLPFTVGHYKVVEWSVCASPQGQSNTNSSHATQLQAGSLVESTWLGAESANLDPLPWMEKRSCRYVRT